jgi:hypothetical protein
MTCGTSAPALISATGNPDPRLKTPSPHGNQDFAQGSDRGQAGLPDPSIAPEILHGCFLASVTSYTRRQRAENGMLTEASRHLLQRVPGMLARELNLRRVNDVFAALGGIRGVHVPSHK